MVLILKFIFSTVVVGPSNTIENCLMYSQLHHLYHKIVLILFDDLSILIVLAVRFLVLDRSMGWMDGWMDKWIGGWVEGRKEGRKEGWMDGLLYVIHTEIPVVVDYRILVDLNPSLSLRLFFKTCFYIKKSAFINHKWDTEISCNKDLFSTPHTELMLNLKTRSTLGFCSVCLSAAIECWKPVLFTIAMADAASCFCLRIKGAVHVEFIQ